MSKLHKTIKHPAVTIPLATFAALLTLTVLALVLFSTSSPELRESDTFTAIVSHDDEVKTVPTRAKTVGELLERIDVTLNPGDVVEPALESEITSDNFRINVYRAVPATIVDGGKKTFAFTAATTPRSVVKQTGIEVYPEDILEFIPTKNFLLEGSIGQRVVIDRATPVHVNLYGTQVMMRTHAKTVGDLLDERNVNLGPNDSVQPARSTKITSNLQVFLLQKGEQIAAIEEEVPMAVEYVDDSSLSFGAQAIRQQGAPGKKIVTYKIQLENGIEVGREIIQEVVVTEPVKQIVARGPQGSFEQALALLRQCEAGGRYNAVSASGTYMGAYQFNQGTWNTNAPDGYAGVPPSEAPAVIQDIAATNLYKSRGWQPWPACSRKAGLEDIYR